MPLKLKLPEKIKQDVFSKDYKTYNDALDEVESLNPPLEPDINAMLKLISEHHSGNYDEARSICEHLIANAPRWLKEKK